MDDLKWKRLLGHINDGLVVPVLGSQLHALGMQAFAAMRKNDWELYTETLANGLWGWPQPEIGRRAGKLLRDSVEAEFERRNGPVLETLDVTELLPRVTCPTLVLNRSGVPDFDLAISHDLAAALPNARLELLDGDTLVPYMGDVSGLVRLITEFLDG